MARTSKKKRTEQVDAGKVADLMNDRGWTVEDLAHEADVSVGTVSNVLSGNGGRFSKTVKKLRLAFGLTSNNELLVDSAASAVPLEVASQQTVHEYQVADVLTDWITASNGLKFQICRLRHLELDRQARGKRYDLRGLSTEEEARCRSLLQRHPEVCETLKEHPNIIRNLTAFRDPHEPFYWVIDDWIEGQSLERRLRSGPLSRLEARNLMLDVAEGLHALHCQRIVRRELTPSAILLRAEDHRAILSEFELAKLIDRGSSVSTDEWPTDPYRAPEADSDDVNKQADLYSWARISLHALTGELPDNGCGVQLLAPLKLPKAVSTLLIRSQQEFRSNRPENFGDVLPALRKWKPA